MKLIKRKMLFFLILLLISLFIYIRQFSESTPIIKDGYGNKKPESIALLEKVELGGMDQWIQVRGNHASNPILLWLHGGPGSAQMPVAHYFNGALEKDFIVVQWDQRGAGKSNPSDFDEGTMTFEQFIADAHDLTEYLKKRFNKERIYLLGHSWGSQLGIILASTYPDDYYAYVGVSQVVDNRTSNEIAYDWLQDQLKKGGKQKDLEKLKKLGSPPFIDHDTFVKFINLVDFYGGGMDVGMGKLAWIALRSPEYRLTDFVAWIQGSSRGSGPMWESSQSFDLIGEVPRLIVPVYFFSGRDDYNTPLQLVNKYLEILDAPKGKELVIFEKSSHTPFMGEPEKFNREMVRVKEMTFHQDESNNNSEEPNSTVTENSLKSREEQLKEMGLPQTGENVFDPKKVKVGDKIIGFILKEIQVFEGTDDYPIDTLTAEFEGTVQLNGTVEFIEKDTNFILDDYLRFKPDMESATKLPLSHHESVNRVIVFKNQDEAISAFNMRPGEVKQNVRIEINNFKIQFLPTDAENTAVLIKVLRE